MKKFKVGWALFQFWCWIRGEYQPPFGSVGQAIQSGRITRSEAVAYLDHTNVLTDARLSRTKADSILKENGYGG